MSEPRTTGLRVIVCGGRSYDDRSAVYAALDRLHVDTPLVRLIHGAATGADTLAHEWAVERGIMDEAFPANWEKNGRAAGPIRNKAMIILGKPHLVVAFPGGHGTADMVRRARAAGIEVWKPLEEAYA